MYLLIYQKYLKINVNRLLADDSHETAKPYFFLKQGFIRKFERKIYMLLSFKPYNSIVKRKTTKMIYSFNKCFYHPLEVLVLFNIDKNGCKLLFCRLANNYDSV